MCVLPVLEPRATPEQEPPLQNRCYGMLCVGAACHPCWSACIYIFSSDVCAFSYGVGINLEPPATPVLQQRKYKALYSLWLQHGNMLYAW